MNLEPSKGKPRLRDYNAPRYWLPWVFIAVVKFFSFLPLKVCWLLGAVTGEIVYRIHRTPTIKTNVRMCFPDWTDGQRARFIRRYYRNISYSFYCLGLAWFGSDKRLRRVAKLVGHEHCLKALEAGSNVILLAPHTVGMEVGGIRLAMDQPAIYLYSKPKNDLIHEALYYYRTRHSGVGIARFDSLRPLIKDMKSGLPFYYLPDQDPDRSTMDYVFVPFMGVQAATFTAPARIAKITKAVVLPCYSRQLSFGRGFEFVINPPMKDFPSGDNMADARAINAEMEKIIEAMPDQYLWSYRRFKTRPDNAPSPYIRK
jgi:KDO2-lipid IV(A) lauroyltransferase